MEEKNLKKDEQLEEEEAEAYCSDSIEEVPADEQKRKEVHLLYKTLIIINNRCEEDTCITDTNESQKSSIDDHILRLTSDLMQEKTYDMELTPFDDKINFQDRIDQMIIQMRDITKFLNVKCGMVDKMNILMCILTFKIFDIQHNFNVKLDMLKLQRENIIMSKSDESMIPVELLDLDRVMRELQYRHHERSRSYKQQKIAIFGKEFWNESTKDTLSKEIVKVSTYKVALHLKQDMQLEYEKITAVLDQRLEVLKNNLRILEEEHEKFVGETKRAEPLLIDYIIQAAVEEFTILIEQFEVKQTKGWKSLYGDEEMLDKLQSRGLAVSKSGYILTEAGDKFSYDEAERRELLEGLDFRSRIFNKDDEQRNEDFVQTPSLVETLEGSEKESLGSQISSEDVSYLKETLGKPLTLAIAEITAKQPRDPIHYLGHWLFKYRYNQELDETQKQEYEALMLERNRLLKEKLQRLYEEEAKLVIFEMIKNAENEAIRKELERILREQVMGGEDEENDQAYKEYEELKNLLKMVQKSAENN